MVVDTENLITVASYARVRGISLTTVYRWIEEGSIESVVIDGVKFIYKNFKGEKYGNNIKQG